MTTVGVRELKQQVSELIRRVRENGEVIVVTHHGKAVARIVPVPTSQEDTTRAWEDLDRLAGEIGRHWPKGVSAAEAVSETRR